MRAVATHPSNHSLTLERGLRLLRTLAEHPEGLTVSELAGELGTHRAGIYRLLRPHLAQRLVRRDAGDRYRLGAGLIELAGSVQPRLREVAGPLLQELADALGATTALTVRDGPDEAVVVDVRSPRSVDLHIAYRPGLRHPVHVAASGLAILAGGPPRPGERAEVARARRLGWAVSTGELLPGATGVAAPVLTRPAAGEPGGVTGADAGARSDAGADAGAEAAISAVWVGRRDNAAIAATVAATAAAIAARLV